MTSTTVLRLSGVGVPPYSARGLRQTLEPIMQAAQLRRTVNGILRDLSVPQMRKYLSTIVGEDQQPPALGAAWPGLQLTIDCITELSIEGTHDEPTEPNEPTEPVPPFDRPVVPGSVRHESGFTFYRPRLRMRVSGFQVTRDEWGALVDWQLVTEEV